MRGLALPVLALLGLPLAGCLTISDISRTSAHALVEHGALLIDVRSSSEFAAEHPSQATNVPLETFRKHMPERGRPIVVYCHTGVRAAIATKWLREAGYSDVHNLGAITHWYVDRSLQPASFE